jgi:hypothetical protein
MVSASAISNSLNEWNRSRSFRLLPDRTGLLVDRKKRGENEMRLVIDCWLYSGTARG